MQPAQFVEEMREALGAESSGLWVIFMDKVRVTLPFLLDTAGRPKVDVIRSSVIGAAGFDSWGQMIEASPDNGGLGWSIDSWKAWKKAYSVVQQHPYLRRLELTASEVNTLSREFDPFPSTAEELEEAKSERKRRLEAKRGNSVSALRNQIDERQSALDAMTTKYEVLVGDFDSLLTEKHLLHESAESAKAEHQQTVGKLAVAQERVRELEATLADREKTVLKQKQTINTLQAKLARYTQMSWFERLLAVFSKTH